MIPITKPYFDDSELEYLKKSLESGWVTQGPMTELFEQKFKKYHPSKHAYAVSSCTAALHIAMLALGIKPGDEVIVPAYTWITSASCVEYVGASVRFVDVKPDTYNMDPDKLEAEITERTKAIIVVHLFGCAADMDEIMAIANRYNLRVVEDCACAIGTKYKGKPVGTIGDIGCFSFHPRKAITTGEGGICCTDDDEIAARICQLRNHGARVDKDNPAYGHPYYMNEYDIVGYNLRMSDIQAAVGVAQFDKLEMLLKDRQDSAAYYRDRLSRKDNVILPNGDDIYGHTYQSFVVILADHDVYHRNCIMDYMKEKGIQTRPGTVALHRTKYNRNRYSLGANRFPVACISEDCSITLPIYPFMKREDQDIVIEALLSC